MQLFFKVHKVTDSVPWYYHLILHEYVDESIKRIMKDLKSLFLWFTFAEVKLKE